MLKRSRQHNTTSGLQLLGLSIAQAAGLTVLAILCGLSYHFVNDEGFLARPDATASIEQAHLINFIPKINERKVRQLLNNATIFIDARFPYDFEEGHLKGAINIPVNFSDDKRRKAMADVAKKARIVIYSQSASCKFAEKVAIKLVSDGFSNVSLFKDGWKNIKSDR